jgi:RNA polymerase sigma-70 factor (ECF subfamily)
MGGGNVTAEDDLIRRAVQGDEEAFDALVKPYQARAYRTACLITRNPDTAADALQEALLRAYRALPNIQPGHPFYPWFARIVVNEALRQAKRQHTYLSLPPLLMKREQTPEDLIQTREDRELLWWAIQHLTPAHRAVIVLRYYEELSEAEMAKILDVPSGTVKSRLHHARAALERVLRRGRPLHQRVHPMSLGGE